MPEIRTPRTYYGAKFDLLLEPSQPIIGVITDKTTGKPIPNVVVRHGRRLNESVRAVTDADGRFSLVGLRTGEQELIAVPPIDSPYFLREFTAGRTANQQPVTVSPNYTAASG